MSESSTSPPADGEPFDAEEFARRTVKTIEDGDAYASVLERRVIRIEECIAARWPRRWLLWARLRREIRASVATWDEDYIPRENFYGRRLEAAGMEASNIIDSQDRARAHGWPEPGTAGPGEGVLP